jgi:hypothetical protein
LLRETLSTNKVRGTEIFGPDNENMNSSALPDKKDPFRDKMPYTKAEKNPADFNVSEW